MSLVGVIASFATGTYTVSRPATGSYVDGRWQAGAPSTFDITASIQPARGRELAILGEGQHGPEIRVCYTTSDLRATPGGCDVVTIDGERWNVVRVERWQAFGGDASGNHWRAYLARNERP